ncbi:MAG: helix-turn-helix transcriptional regulator [Lachnospiraceae bacterium]|nr:helix-turn-helix transcriptional regulator [Lachnospiraceae bacterium]
MSDIAKSVGQRIRNYRNKLGLSQERLAELAGCHPTYIGQVERGEKNASLESIEKISSALKLPLEKLFEKIEPYMVSIDDSNIPLKCYNYLSSKTQSEQELIYEIIQDIDKYKRI